MTNTNEFDAALKTFIANSQEKINTHFAKSLPNLTPPTLTTMEGSKFIRIVQKDHPGNRSGSAWAFIKKETGDILKAASWTAPAKHARGNIFSPETWETVTVYGPAYLR